MSFKGFWKSVGTGLVKGAVWTVGHPEVLQIVEGLAKK